MAALRYPYTRFSSFSKLFSTYAGEFDLVSSQFAGDYRDPRQRGQIALQVADHFQSRTELTQVLADQNRSFGAGAKTFRNIERLAEPETVAVVTGQQLGLFAGPMYTIYKTITAIQLARRIEEDTARPVVPIFWLEGEDHDIDEVSSVSVYSGNDLQRVVYSNNERPAPNDPLPVGRIVFDEHIQSAISELKSHLPPTDFRDDVMERIGTGYRPGATFLQAFTSLMNSFFQEYGVIFVSSDDRRLKKLAAPIFRKEIREYAKTASLLSRASSKLADAYHVQVQTDPTNLFMITDSGRRAIAVDNGSYRLKGTDITYSQEDLLSLIDTEPERFSPNVVLRPIVQDALLPTAAYVAGPGEVAYFAQFKTIYEWAGVPMPVIYPRASVTLLESKIKKILDRYDTSIPVFEEQVEKIFHSLIIDAMEVDAEAIFERAGRHLHDAVNTVKPAIESVDKSLTQSAEATRAALLKEWTRLKERVIKAEKRRHEQTLDQLSKTKSNLFPGDALQERTISPLYFMNKYGTDLIDRLIDDIDLDTSAHQVIAL